MRSARADSSVKILGMIGGTGPESTVEYYRRLIATYHARVSESGAPPIIINSVDDKNLVKWFTAGDLAAVINFLAAEIERLVHAGADFALIAAVTPHLGFDKLQQRVSIPLLSIVEATADAATKGGLRRLALFGTRFTMQAPLFPQAFARRGMTIVVPNEEEQEFIHEKYMDEFLLFLDRKSTRLNSSHQSTSRMPS